MQYLRRPRIIVSALAALTLIGLVSYYLPGFAPWVPSGRLIIAVRAVPYTETDLTMGLGVDNMTLSQGEDTTAVNIRERHVVLDPTSDALTVILDTQTHTGTYSGFGFSLTSPELRNPWQSDTPPTSVALMHETVAFPISYTIQENETTVVILAFETLQALHDVDGDNKYLPVVQVETRQGGSVGADERGAVRIEGGAISGSATYGMDWDGRMRHNFRAPLTQEHELVPEPVDLTTDPFVQSTTAASTTIDTPVATGSPTVVSTTSDDTVKP